jgi:hypothetical protein
MHWPLYHITDNWYKTVIQIPCFAKSITSREAVPANFLIPEKLIKITMAFKFQADMFMKDTASYENLKELILEPKTPQDYVGPPK